MKIGVMQAILGLKPDVVLDAAGNAGFDGVQLVIGSDYMDNPLWTERGTARL